MSHPPTICGIDPGRTGAVAFVGLDGAIHSVCVMPTMDALADLIDTERPELVCLEKAQAMPKNGAVSMFNYGDHFGQIQGILIALLRPYHLVAPVTWTKKMHIGSTGLTAKARSLEAVKRRWPMQNLRASERSKIPHEGIVDALLIAEYGRVHIRLA